jgi:hypothetical protein
VPFTVLTAKNGRIDTFSIVPHAQSKLLIVIADFNLNLPGLGVLKRVPQRFGSDPVDLVTKNRMQISRLALNCYSESRSLAGRVGCEFLSERAYGQREIVALDGGLA